jgi:hypothetical protein
VLEVATRPTDILLVFLVFRIVNDFQKLLVSIHAAYIFRRTATFAA